MINVLIVEDEESIANLIKISLPSLYNSKIASDGEEALKVISANDFDLILLDVMIPKLSGFELMEYISDMNIPVIFITAMNSIQDKVKGLKLGADDYITKPFDISELLARIEAVLRRNNKYNNKIYFKDIEIDKDSHVVLKSGLLIDLTKKEYDLLLLLFQNKNVALYREIIYERVWKDDFMGDTRTVDLHIQRLRKKLDLEKEIQTVYKVGYRFEVKDEI